jgi:hypothetical protein
MSRLSKKDLCIQLGLHSPNMRYYYNLLRRDYFTDDALQILQLTPEQYNKIRIFSKQQSFIIVNQLFQSELIRIDKP